MSSVTEGQMEEAQPEAAGNPFRSCGPSGIAGEPRVPCWKQ
jgi:hypothetical protein